ncbi:protein of unknown function (plasmid) [Azospirillum baldaniorum]|uniref:Uncharacterized protein n=1 Tax=Azospirillum baldaniorum TaxID=1064539 RepID=A0A9P1JYJ1_9PROT|nr:protein of unknown function [Azospirillum baldaniorum]
MKALGTYCMKVTKIMLSASSLLDMHFRNNH